MPPELDFSATPSDTSSGSDSSADYGGMSLDDATDTIGEGLGLDTGDDNAGNDAPADEEYGGAADPEAKPVATAKPEGEGEPDPNAAPDPLLTPPKTWSKEEAAEWANMSEAARKAVLRREEDMFRGIETYKADATFAKPLREALAPFMPVLEHYRIDPAQQISGLMQTHFKLATGSPQERAAIIKQVAQDYGVDLLEVATTVEPYVDPQVKALQDQLNGVKSELTAAQQRQQAQARQAFEADVARFAADPANRYFDEVVDDIAAFLKSGVAKDLKDAYERAVWANPVVRAKEQARQDAEKAEAQRTREREKAAAARKATAANVRVSAKRGSQAAPLGSMDDTLRETLAAISRRGS